MDLQLKEIIEELEERYCFISDNLNDAIWIVDLKTFKFEYITSSIEKISGYPSDEYLGFTIMDRIAPDSYKQIKKLLLEAKKDFKEGRGERIKTFELEFLHKDGHSYWVELKARLFKKDNNPIKIVGTTRDISSLKKAENKINNLTGRLKALVEEKDKLLSENKILMRLLPVCSRCKRIHDEKSEWLPLDLFVKDHTGSELTHSICPNCTDVINDE